MNLRKEKTKRYDQARHALQAPIRLKPEPIISRGFRGAMYHVLYVKDKREHQSPWYYHEANAEKALAAMRAKYGEKNAIIFVA